MNDTLGLYSEVRNSLQKFDIVLLEHLPEEAQMERVDRKFAFHVDQIPEILSGLTPHYSVVKAADDVISPYHSQYLDTNDFLFYRQHHSGLRGRRKVRYRTYLRTNASFLEIKHKSNKGRTSKTRIAVSSTEFPLKRESIDFLAANDVLIHPEALMVSANVDYDRIALVASCGTERFSVDFNIKTSFNSKHESFGNLAILEVKQDQSFTSPIVARLRKLGIREGTLSKYCLSLSMIDKKIKSNNFKAALRRIKKINEKRYYFD